MTKYLTSRVLKNFKHGFFCRTGGVSINEFSSLNCKYLRDDNKSKVILNRTFVSNLMGIKTSNLITLKQIHSSDVIMIKKKIEPDDIEGDSMVTSNEGICLGILTADCAPVLFGDFEKKIIGAAHVGWRGLYAGIVENTIESMIQLGAKIHNICAAIGPCIQKNNYEVGIEFYDRFINKDNEFKRFFFKDNNKKIWFDLSGLISFKLELSGVYNIHSLNKCTFSEKKNYFSFRRNQKNKLGDCGRMISTIKI
ncbi:MAG: peptidoglycan editing factor PgeF [Paracoccaceae bacterium]